MAARASHPQDIAVLPAQQSSEMLLVISRKRIDRCGNSTMPDARSHKERSAEPSFPGTWRTGMRTAAASRQLVVHVQVSRSAASALSSVDPVSA